MRRLFAAVVVGALFTLVALGPPARAYCPHAGNGHQLKRCPFTPPAVTGCTGGKLDFSQACNSVLAAVIF